VSNKQSYHYSVKIKSGKSGQQVIRQLHNFTEKFSSIAGIKLLLIDKFGEQVPDNLDFNLGYFEGSKKRWLCSKEDLDAMYKCLKKDEEVMLWCESIANLSKRKKEGDVPISKRQAKEDEIDCTFQLLKKKHNEKYEIPKLRLWARMVTSGLHESTDEPPDIPAFRGGGLKKKKTTVEAIGGVMDALVKIVEQKAPGPPNTPAKPDIPMPEVSFSGVSPSRAAELRMKNFEQLRYLQGLFDDGIITDNELVEQKRMVLDALRKLT